RPLPPLVLAPRASIAAATAAAPSTAAAIAVTRRTLLALPRRGVLRPLDQLLGLDEPAVLVLRDQLEADSPALLVHLLNDHVEHVAPADHILDVTDPAGADVRHVEQAVRPLLQLDERAELGRLDYLARVGVPHLGLLRHRLDHRDGGVGLRAFGRIDEDRAVLLDVDLNVVLALDRPNRLAALADHHADVVGVDLDRRDARRVRSQLFAGLRDRLGHPVEDELAGPPSLVERRAHDLLRHAGDLDVHLE